MPTYEYACAKCGHTFETFQSMKAEPLKKCPKCGKNSLKRLLGAGAGLIFKGSGFYITDYKNKAGGGAKESGGDSKSMAKPAEAKSGESKSSESKSTGGGGDSKPSGTAPKTP